jgi:3-hydroxyisobutyrate dehydrogenase-like beta-hydroxyacid dehydrogenase
MKIGFIGLGAMGHGMAANLQKAGHDLVVNDMRPEAAAEYLDNGATWASAPGELAMQLARESGVPMRLCSLTAQEMTEALNRGWGDRDSQSFLLLQQERAGVPPFEMTEQQVQSVLSQHAESAYNVR